MVELATGKERLITLEAPFNRVAAVDFLGADVIVAALKEGGEGNQDWSVLVIDPAGKVTSSGLLTKGTVSGALAVGPEGQVAVVVSTMLFSWEPGELLAGKAPHTLELGQYTSEHDRGGRAARAQRREAGRALASAEGANDSLRGHRG